MSSSSLCTTDENDFLRTPAKRRYKRRLFCSDSNTNDKIYLPNVRDCSSVAKTNVSLSGSSEMTVQEEFEDNDTFSSCSESTEKSSNSCDLSSDESDCEIDMSSSEASIFSHSDACESANESVFLSENDDLDFEIQNNNSKHGNQFIYEGASHTFNTSYLSIMLFVMKHSLTNDAFSDLLSLIHTHLPKETKFTTSVYRLKEYLKTTINFEKPVKHFYCDTCNTLLKEGNQCQRTDCQNLNSKSLMFHDLNLERQLKELLKDESFCKLTLDRQSKVSHVADALKDICDGCEYQRLMHLPNIDSKERNLTFTMNTDGVALFSSSKKGSLWPVYLAVNELPVNLRFSKKYIITSHLYCQPEKPSMLTYLSPLMDSLKKLHCEGLTVATPRGKLLVRFHLLAVTLDLPARAMVLNMKQFNGKFGCCYCEDEGKNPPNCPMHRYYPYNRNPVLRQHHSMINDARKAATGDAVKGIKGASPLVSLRYIDLPKTFVIDWMHSVLLGVVKTILSLWFDASYKGNVHYIGDKIALINGRLLGIQIPDYIMRQQRNIEDFKHWKASECREWLLHFSVPVISGIQNADISIHYALLVTAIFILNQEVVSESELAIAEECLKDFCSLFPQFYDPKKQTMNIHLLCHLTQFVRLHGPLFHYSCFGFESMNNHLKKMVHGTRFINDQICFAVGMAKCLPDLVKSTLCDVNCKVKALTQHLSKHLLSDGYVEQKEVRPLGAEKIHILTDTERNLFGRQHVNQVSKYHRVETNIGVIYSEEYKRTQNRNSYSIMYIDEQQNKLFGNVKFFVKSDDNLFAVVNRFSLTENSLLNFSQLNANELKKYRSKNLCFQLKQLCQQQNECLELVDVANIRFKCVLIDCQMHKKFISMPPNILEHN